MMVIGIAGMFLAPFGMLISKWAAIQAFIDAPFGLAFVVILIFGSALTLFFWAKWMGKLLVITPNVENVEGAVDKNEWIALVSLAGLYHSYRVYLPGHLQRHSSSRSCGRTTAAWPALAG